MLLVVSGCSKNNDEVVDETDDITCGEEEEIPTPQDREALDLSKYTSGQKVMMQTFYWDVEHRFEWWNNLSDKVEGWADAGIDRLWLPVVTKGQSGGYSMGYDPSDYYDFGEYDQHGTVPTRFGTREELENLIKKSTKSGLR